MAPAGDRHDHAHSDMPAVTERQFPEGDETSSLDVELRDFSFVGMPASTKGPNVQFSARVSTGEHELLLQDSTGETLAAAAAFKPDDGPRVLAVVLQPATYTIVCLVSEGAKTHDQLGMKTTLVVE